MIERILGFFNPQQEVKPGQIWFKKNDDPFGEDFRLEIQEIRGGWCSYKWPPYEHTIVWSMEIKSLLAHYTLEKDV